MDKPEMEWFDRQVKEFTQIRPRYEGYAAAIQEILVQATHALDVAAIVQARAKTIASLNGPPSSSRIWP